MAVPGRDRSGRRLTAAGKGRAIGRAGGPQRSEDRHPAGRSGRPLACVVGGGQRPRARSGVPPRGLHGEAVVTPCPYGHEVTSMVQLREGEVGWPLRRCARRCVPRSRRLEPARPQPFAVAGNGWGFAPQPFPALSVLLLLLQLLRGLLAAFDRGRQVPRRRLGLGGGSGLGISAGRARDELLGAFLSQWSVTFRTCSR